MSLLLLGDLVSLYLAVLPARTRWSIAGRLTARKGRLAEPSPPRIRRTVDPCPRSKPPPGRPAPRSSGPGEARTDAPGGRLTSTNPARTSEVVAEVLLGDAATFAGACRAARAAQSEWAACPRPRAAA